MIRYALRCDEAHCFESWFQSADAFDKVLAAGLVTCPDCGSNKVEKAVMAPQVRPGRNEKAAPPPAKPDPAKSLEKLREKVERESEYVGKSFADEARAIHTGEAPERSIYGEARVEDAKKLVKDGIPVAPLPFVPSRKLS